MAKYADGTNYAKFIDPKSENIIDPGLIGGKVRVFQDTVTISTTPLNSTDYIVVGGKLPTGSQVVKIILGAGSAAQTAATLVVGDQGDADRYLKSTAATALTGSAVFIGPNVATGMYYTVTGVTDNYIRLTGANNATIMTPGTIRVSIFYTVE